HRALLLTSLHEIPPGEILVVTYSKAAAEQMRKRYLALGGNNAITFGTFHAVFFRVLRARYSYATGNVLSEDERRSAVKRMLKNLRYDLEDEFVSSVLNELSLVKNELFDLKYYHAVSVGSEDFLSIFEQYADFKRESGKIDFDDMLSLCYELFMSEPDALGAWRMRFPYIMIDEFQDINRVQYECVKLLAAPANNIFIVGDDDQSVYRFRGARPEFLLHFPKDFPDTGRVVLDTNYRSPDPVIAYANKLIAGNKIRYGKLITGTGRAGAPVTRLTADDQNAEAVVIAEKIKALRKNGALSFDDFAVIYRLNIQARALADAFMYANIPYQIKDEAPTVYEHWIAKDFFAFLRLGMETPVAYSADIERIINKPYRYIGKAFLLSAKKANVSPFVAYKRDAALNDLQKTRIEELVFYIKACAARSPADAIKYIRQAVGYDQHIRDHCEYRKLNPAGLFEIADELQDAAKPFQTAAEFLEHAGKAVEASRQNKEDRGPSVTLTTLHSAKGLEFGTVFIAGAVDGVIPHERSKTEAELEEERRLLYVGVTRAKDALYVSATRMRYDKTVKPSRFIVNNIGGANV
ncbi:MAG: ATP-dependent helicase, partial [Clostridiales bacterium]|nr:ATP-dependent helicase [Clostridiales bacterium]